MTIEVSDSDIRALRDQALAFGDFEQAALCEAALSHADDHPGPAGRAYAAAREKCAEVILATRTRAAEDADVDYSTAICALCGAERPMEVMMAELVSGGMAWVCGGIDPVTGEDAITDCEIRRGI